MFNLVLGSRPGVGHVTLDHGTGVRIPASQPFSLSGPLRLVVRTGGSQPSNRGSIPLGAAIFVRLSAVSRLWVQVPYVAFLPHTL